MRAFILTTGRSGSTTFAKACAHIINYTSGHESRADKIKDRCAYPEDHIEVDNRLSWFLGTLDRLYGTDPLYIHLTRDRDEVIRSYARRRRSPMSIMRATANGILQRREPPKTDEQWQAVSGLVVDTVTDNINLFLGDKPNVIDVTLDNIQVGFDEMWARLGCEGDIEAAHAELRKRHNATPEGKRNW